VGAAVGYQGTISFDASKPDGSPRKWMDSGRLNTLGWQAKVELQAGLLQAYQEFCTHHPDSK
jgi:GDP-L-fucose synthase